MNGKEKRRSFRITESVYLKYEILNDEEFHEGLERRKLRLGLNDGTSAKLVDIDARLSQAMYMLSAESDHLGKCITLLNDKINYAIDQLPGLRKTKSSLASMPPQTCDVSADGMVFATNERLAVGTRLYLQFLLESDNRYIESFCTVVRDAEPPSNDSELMYGVAVDFHCMKSEQREILIQHMFRREADTLRLRRLEIEAAEP